MTISTLRTYRIQILIILALIVLGVFGIVQAAQLDANTCPALIEKALDAVGNNCSGLDRNSACYGFNDVNAIFSEQTAADFFTQPSDRAGLVDLKEIGTSPLSAALDKWGIALLSVQANLPDTLPGQNVVFMMLGDTQVENAVQPDAAFSGGTPVTVKTLKEAAQFYLPSTDQRIVGTIPANTFIAADATDTSGGWLRVAYNGIPGWISTQTIDSAADLTSLPPFTPSGSQTPMQTFYLRTGLTGTKCTQAPDSLIVQGPQQLQVDINVNGADIRLGSTIALRLVPISPELANALRPLYPDIDQVTVLLELDVIDGHAILYPGTDHEEIVNSGFYTLRCLSDPGNLGLDGVTNDRHVFDACPWLNPIQWRDTTFDTFEGLEGFTLNYPIHLPTPTPTPTPKIVYPTPTPTCQPTEEIEPTLTPTPTDTVTEEILDPKLPARSQPRIRQEGDPCATIEPTEEVTDEPTEEPTSEVTDVVTDTPTPTSTPTYTDTPTVTFTPTDTDTPTPTDTPTNTATPTPSNTPTDTATPTPTDTPFFP